MEQHDPAFALRPGSDKRRSVGKPRPAAIGEFDRRLGKNLARHRHVGRNGQACERTGFGKRRQPLRFGPGERAAKITSADAQFHRHQIVGAARHALARETDQQSAAGNELGDLVVVAAGDPADIGEDEHGNIARQKIADRALAHIGIGRERTLQIIEIGEQGLFVLVAAGRNDADGAMRAAAAQKLNRAGGVRVRNGNARGLVAHFQRKNDMRRRAIQAAIEVKARTGEHFVMAAQRR